MYEFTRVLYSRDLTHSQHILMEELIEACQRLFKQSPRPLWDQLYLLKVINYRELQKQYGKQLDVERE